jgi:ATP-binding cassette subfamily B protein
VNGTDLREFDLAAWRRRVALVAQDTVLFRGSLRDNVRYLHPDADDAAVREALARAQLGELLARLPEGLDTAIGERGARLSGGERQRLAIARALLQDPLLVLFDEATSAVDAEAERALMREVEVLFPGTTRLFISHREAPLAAADLLLEVRDGTVRVLRP